MVDDSDPIRFSGFRIAFYLFSSAWMFFFLAFEDSASHFGWGFFPMLASIVVVPVILCALFADLVMRIADVFTTRSGAVLIRITALAIPTILLFGSGIWIYYLYAS